MLLFQSSQKLDIFYLVSDVGPLTNLCQRLTIWRIHIELKIFNCIKKKLQMQKSGFSGAAGPYVKN